MPSVWSIPPSARASWIQLSRNTCGLACVDPSMSIALPKPQKSVHHSEFLDEGIPPSVCLGPKLIPLSVGDRWRRDRRFKTGIVERDIVAIEQYQHVGRI